MKTLRIDFEKVHINPFITLIILLGIILCSINFSGFLLSDQYLYIKNAYLLAHKEFNLSPSVFNNRFSIIYPISRFMDIFGYSEMSTILWSLLLYLYSAILIYFVAFKTNEALALKSAILFLLIPIVVKQSADVLPDLALMAFGTTPVFLYYLHKIKLVRNSIYPGLLFGCAIFLAFLAKETIIYIFPFYSFYFIKDIWHRRNNKFWLIASITACILFGLYFYAYYLYTTNPLFRFSGIESEHNQSELWSYYRKPILTIINRLTFEPVVFLFTNYHLVFLSIPTLLLFIQNQKSKTDFLKNYTLYTCFALWFLSTSTHFYNPLPMNPRMWILLIPPMVILSIESLLSIKELNKRIISSTTVFLLVFVCLLFVTLTNPNHKLSFSFIYFFILIVLVIRNSLEIFRRYTFIIFIAPLIIFHLSLIPSRIKGDSIYFEEKRVINYLKNLNKPVEVITDPVLYKRHDIYFDFQSSKYVNFNSWQSIEKIMERKEKYYIINTTRISAIQELYDISPPSEIHELLESEGRKIFSGNHVKLYLK